MVAGFQVPLMPLLDTAGRAGAADPIQSGPIAVNTGVICRSMVTSSVVATAHCPAAGVNVYVVVPTVVVLITAGFQVPLIPLLDVAGNAGAVLFWQSVPIGLNVGVRLLLTTI